MCEAAGSQVSGVSEIAYYLQPNSLDWETTRSWGISYHGSCSQVLSSHRLSYDSARRVGRCTESDLRKERCDVARKALRLLCSTKVPAARHCGPPTNVVQSLHPFPRRTSLGHIV